MSKNSYEENNIKSITEVIRKMEESNGTETI